MQLDPVKEEKAPQPGPLKLDAQEQVLTNHIPTQATPSLETRRSPEEVTHPSRTVNSVTKSKKTVKVEDSGLNGQAWTPPVTDSKRKRKRPARFGDTQQSAAGETEGWMPRGAKELRLGEGGPLLWIYPSDSHPSLGELSPQLQESSSNKDLAAPASTPPQGSTPRQPLQEAKERGEKEKERKQQPSKWKPSPTISHGARKQGQLLLPSEKGKKAEMKKKKAKKPKKHVKGTISAGMAPRPGMADQAQGAPLLAGGPTPPRMEHMQPHQRKLQDRRSHQPVACTSIRRATRKMGGQWLRIQDTNGASHQRRNQVGQANPETKLFKTPEPAHQRNRGGLDHQRRGRPRLPNGADRGGIFAPLQPG